MSKIVGSEMGAYGRSLTQHVETFVREHWDWKGLPLNSFEQLNAGLLAMAWQQEEPAQCRALSVPLEGEDKVNWAHIAALDAYLRTQRAGNEAVSTLSNTFKVKEQVYCDAPNGEGWVAEISLVTGSTIKAKSLLEQRTREVEASSCRRIAHYPYEGKNIVGEFYSMKFLEWQRRIGQGVAQGRRILRMAQGFPQPNGALAVIVTDTRPRTLEKLFIDLPFLPAAFAPNSRDACYGLPFVPRIILVSSVQEARQYTQGLRAKHAQATMPHLYVEGRARFQNHWADLRNEFAQGEWKSITLLGSEPGIPITNYVRWRWSAEEMDFFFNRRQEEAPEKIRLKLTAVREHRADETADLDAVARLQAAVKRVLLPLQALAQGNPSVRPQPVYYFLNEYLRHILPPGQECDRARAWLQRQHERTRAYLLGHESEEEQTGEQFADAFYEAGIFSEKRIQAASQELEQAFAELNAFFQQESPKHRHLTSSLKKSFHENPAGGRYVLADRENYHNVHATYHDDERRVSVLRLHDNEGQIPSFQRITRSPLLNSSQAHFLVPYLFNRDQYENMGRAQGQVKLFLYEQIEDGKFENVQQAAERRDEARLLEASRSRFCPVSYAELVAQAKQAAAQADSALNTDDSAFHTEDFASPSHPNPSSGRPLGAGRTGDFFAQLYALDEAGYARETQDRVVESRPFTVRFTNRDTTVMEGSKHVLRLEAGGYVRRHVSELGTGDEVLFYENEDRDLNYQILLAQDQSGVMAKIEHYSGVWRRTLKQLKKLCEKEHILFHALQRHGFPVAMLSLQNYLDGVTRFPMHEATLRAVQALARERGMADCPLCQDEEFRALLSHRAKYQQLSKGLGRGLSDELLRHRVTGQRGPLLLALDEAVIDVLGRSVKNRTVAQLQPR